MYLKSSVSLMGRKAAPCAVMVTENETNTRRGGRWETESTIVTMTNVRADWTRVESKIGIGEKRVWA